jgi:hypothetical protein
MKTLMAMAAFALATTLALTAEAQTPSSMAFLFGNALYDASTGESVNPHFLQGPPIKIGTAVASDSNLYVQNFDPTYGPSNYIAKYDLHTGALIDPNFLYLGSSGTSSPTAFAVKGNTLFIPGTDPYLGNTISTYDATTGALIKRNFITGFRAVVVEKLIVWNNTLYIAGLMDGYYFTYAYDATTGVLINPGALNDPFGSEAALAVVDNYLIGFDPYGQMGAYPIFANAGYYPPIGPGGPYAYYLGGPGSNSTPLDSLGNYLFVTGADSQILVRDISQYGEVVASYPSPQSLSADLIVR